MSVAEFIGDEVSAAGYRMCGVDVHVAGPDDALQLIRQACERASLVLVASSTAQAIRADALEELMAVISPPVLVVPDVRGLADVPDIASRIYKQLGMLE